MIGYVMTHPWALGAVSGFVSAAMIDLNEWRKQTGWLWAEFHFGIASKRWMNGAISGALGAGGLGWLGGGQ